MPTRSSLRRPAGVCPWPFSVLFIYTTSISQIITTHDVSHHMYADDTQVYIELSPSDTHKSISSMHMKMAVIDECLTRMQIASKLRNLGV